MEIINQCTCWFVTYVCIYRFIDSTSSGRSRRTLQSTTWIGSSLPTPFRYFEISCVGVHYYIQQTPSFVNWKFLTAGEWVAVAVAFRGVSVCGGEDGGDSSPPVARFAGHGSTIHVQSTHHYQDGAFSDGYTHVADEIHHSIWLLRPLRRRRPPPEQPHCLLYRITGSCFRSRPHHPSW